MFGESMRMHKILPTMILAFGAMPLALTAQEQAAATPERATVAQVVDKILASLGNMFSGEFLPRGFLQMIYLDEEGFDQQHYKFSYAGREFLGDVRCLIFDVDPLANTGKGRFSGRIWVEDQ